MPKRQFDFKKEWGRTKDQLIQFSRKAAKVAKKGEEELIKFSRQSKLHFDSTAATLKKEHLYHLIGKEYAGLKNPAKPSASLKKLVEELRTIEKEQRVIHRKIKVAQAQGVISGKSEAQQSEDV